MTKWLVTATGSKVVFRKISKTNRSLAMVYSRLYRIDDDLFSVATDKPESFVLYDIEEQQPYGRGKWLNPDMTKIFIDSMKSGKGKPTKLFDLNIEVIMAILVVGVVIFSIASQYLG